MIDAAIVGRFLGTQALAGVGATSSVQFLVLGFCTGLCSGFGVPVARDFGANQFGRMRKDIFHGALLTAVIAVILTTGCVLLCPWILKMLSVTEDIYGNARIYILIIFLGLPFTLLYNFLSSILRAVGDSRTPFLFLAFSACLNVVLDLICIIVFKWGCAGAAFATITAQAISGLCCLIFIIKKVQILHPKRKDCHLQPVYVKEMLVMGLPMGLQFSITAIGSMVMQSANNGLGSIYVSGFTAGMRIKQFAMCPFDALADGVSVFCSQNLGAGKIKRIRKGLWQGVGVGFYSWFIDWSGADFCGQVSCLCSLSVRTRRRCWMPQPSICVVSVFFHRKSSVALLSVFRTSAQGMGFSGRAIFSGVTEMIARTFVSFAFVGTYGFTAICFADQTAWVSATLYITPVCLMCLRQVTREHERQQAKIAD